MKEYNRTIDELVAMYTFEKELFDCYVEGISDKFVIENYVCYKNINVKAIEVDSIDFSNVEFQDLDFKSNKDKLILLSRILSKNLIVSDVYCLIDRDFDGMLLPIETNVHLLRTDYSCMESYFMARDIIHKFIDIGIRDFPFHTDFIIEEIGKVLRYLFIVRLVKLKFNLNYPLLKIDNNLNINKKDGIINFNLDDYLSKFIIANNLKKYKIDIEEFVNEIMGKIDPDARNTMNGHDFIEVLFLYINKIKSSTGFKLQTFERAFQLSLQPNYFDQYPFFVFLSQAV